MSERTLVLVKPDGVARALVGEVISRIERKGLRLVALELRVVSTETATTHYAEHVGKPFFPSLLEFITSGPVVAMVVEGDRAIPAFRQLAGGTDPVEKATPGTIRGDFGLQTQLNLVHGSDSAESAAREIGLWFPTCDRRFHSRHGDLPRAEGLVSATAPVELRRVGPGGSMASDNAFAVALLTLWHRVAQDGAPVGFVLPVDRSAVGAAVSEVIGGVRSGHSFAFALTRSRHVGGFALIEPGVRSRSQTGVVALVMVEPQSRGIGWGRLLLQAVLDQASSMSLERLRVGVPSGMGLEEFFARFGFVEIGRSPAWIRLAPGDDREEVLMVRELG